MCFFKKKPKLKSPKITTPIQNTAAPIENQTPKVVEGSDKAATDRATKRKQSSNPNLSLFQIQLLPGATSVSGDAPGANVNDNTGV